MLYAIAAVIVLIIDQAVKYWTNTTLAVGASQSFIPGIMDLQYIQNKGAAWGLLSGANARWFLVALTVIFTIVIIVLLCRNVISGKLGRWMLVLVLAGGIGNGIDRVINGYVVDMFHFLPFNIPILNTEFNFPVFNVADIFVTVCGTIFCIWFLFHKEPTKEVRPPSRPMPKASGHPPKGPDYLELLQRPVAEVRANLASEAAMRRPQPLPVSRPDDDFSNWNLPADHIPTAAPKAEPSAAHRSPPPKPVETPTAAPRPAAPPVRATPDAPQKGAAEFSLEDILSEFKD